MTFFLTIITGFSIFVLGQFFLKLVLEPIVAFKESLGSLSAFCLRNRASITNAAATLEEQNELRLIVSTILSKKHAIPFYSQLSSVLGLPSSENLLLACQNLNFVAYEMYKETTMTKQYGQIVFKLHETSKLLGLRLDFEAL
ncbi:hypothetical protein P0F40_003530 [Vibrio metschnikovii]|uniref:Uncharacterized protein n=2 Tax=Unclassified Bacteria TaxID=49928 RepID=A0AAU6UWY3_UNCXX|nr:hypothetical protein [Vibrio metschnikovii]EKO3594195.1 hypothetical protein [Vibrio metschnikovii]EKO3667702.1 hypothetical protein [Vibrio metschnikovii]EKO3722578.1 hypothetical protein [Vibrio metschnikovii]EKO3726377.1 hypothetical protein [Vibrio metschnikovii]EKO3774857.1 hypothetical protein [Vibrio metschnikovii]